MLKKKANLIFFALILSPIFTGQGFFEPASGATTQQFSYYDVVDNGDGTHTNTIYSDGTPTRILKGGQWIDYYVTENATAIQVETARGSVVYSKSSCALNFYNATTISAGTQPSILADKYLAQMSTNGSGIWTNVNQVNNAACTTSVIQQNKYVEIQSLKHVAGVGDFKIRYIKNFNADWKTTLEPTNLSALTNKQFGVMQNVTVPKLIQVGDQVKDLSQFNGVTLNRTWLDSHKAQLLQFKNGINFDFSIGYSSLSSVSIYYTGGNTATLSFSYTRNAPIVLPGQTLSIDPTFGYTAATNVYTATTVTAATVACPAATSTLSGDGQTLRKYDSGDPTGFCRVESAQWNISSIPAGAQISSASFRVVITATVSDINCNLSRVTNDITAASAQTLYDDIVNSGTDTDHRYYVSNNSYCTTAGTKTISLGTNGTTDIASALGVARFGVGISPYSMKRDGSTHNLVSNTKELTVVYVDPKPLAVTVLNISHINQTTLVLSWTAPALRGGTLSGYQINYTTPWGDPQTKIINDTHSATVSYSVSGLTLETPYSFRVAAWTERGSNATGKIANTTTLPEFVPANFTIGSFSLDSTNPTRADIIYSTSTVNSTLKTVTVTYSKSIHLACDLAYSYAMTNHTYHSLSQTVASSTQYSTTFNMFNATNDIVTFHCYSQNGTADSHYILAQDSFLIKQQVQNFRNGTYGTHGFIGALDLVTIIVIIFAMIGFNRINEAVGGIFCLMAVGALAYFEIITWYATIFSALAVVLMIIIGVVKKD